MRRRIVGLAMLASVLAITLFGVPLAIGVAEYALANEREQLTEHATAVAEDVAVDLLAGRTPRGPLRQLKDGRVAIYDSERDRMTGPGPDAVDREVGEAFSGRVGIGNHDGETVAAVPVAERDRIVGVVRTARPVSVLYERIGVVWAGMAALALLAVGAVWILARRQARRLAAPLEDLSDGARRLGQGDFSVRVAPVAIPEIDSVGEALNSTAGRLDDMLERERAFSAEASHQLRTPLAGLRLRLEAALDTPGQDLRPAVHGAIDDTDRVERTIEELLTLARRTERRDTGELDLKALLDEVEQGWEHRPTSGDRPLRVQVEPQTPASSASTAAIRQALTVLVDNAAVHGAGRVTVTARDAGGALAIDIADQGTGITMSEAELFTRPRGEDGHGIGLALARRLVEAEGGRLRLLTPRPPTFSILLPARLEPLPGSVP